MSESSARKYKSNSIRIGLNEECYALAKASARAEGISLASWLTNLVYAYFGLTPPQPQPVRDRWFKPFEKRLLETMGVIPKEPFTYYVRSEGYVKIGMCRSLKRLHTLRIGNPVHLELLAVEAGDQETPRHRQFQHLRERGEWFRVESELAEHLRVLGEGPLAALVAEYNENVRLGSMGTTPHNRKGRPPKSGDAVAA